MLFNSYEFVLIFLPIVLLIWWQFANRPQIRLSLLVIASYLFYGWNRWEFTLLLAASTIIDYCAGIQLYKQTQPWKRRFWLGISLASNLGMLAYFKYSGFFAESLNSLIEFVRSANLILVPQIALPIGISFYTFQTLSYSIDLYRREVKPAKTFLHFAAYVSMFPQLIAGPIVRYSDIEDQISHLRRRIDWDQFASGIWFFVIGMSQKILIADTIARCIDPTLGATASLQFFAGWYTLLGYSIQLYFDFAGYSNMAIGLGLWLGFNFPTNFNSPYQATSIQDFWRRWHITLSSFLRDYLYIPLGGNRSGSVISLRNLIIVMLLGGLWHGAGWTFVLWGAYHGILLAIYGMIKTRSNYRLPRVVAIGTTFLFVVFGWLLFRSTSMAMAGQWIHAISGANGFETSLSQASLNLKAVAVLAIALAICWFAPNASQISRPKSLGAAVIMAVLFWVCMLRFDSESPFLYFQF